MRKTRDGEQESRASFGARLRGLREVAGLTQEELAFRAGLSPNAVGALERGVRRRPQPHTVRSLADALELSEDERAALLATVPKRGEAALSTAKAAPASSAVSTLPHPATALIGRERDIQEMTDLLARPEVRMLTLTGIGGVGKTRLAVQAAQEVAHLFPDGVTFVELAPLADPMLVTPTVLHSLDLAEAKGRTPTEALIDHLRERSLLLVLDNFEHLLEAAPEVATLVDACPGLVVLATSRAPLRIRGEREHPVPPLVLPATTRSPVEEEILTSPSGMLFAERAQASSPGFTITRENAAAVAAICWRLAGLPLALELAAAKVRFLDPATLLSRLDEALSTAWARDLPERQRTMRATLDWSHDLLSKEERALFRRFSVFAGGFTLEAAEEVCASEEVEPEEILELLGRLVEQSLVVVRTDTEGLRYGMLEPVRQYALERLGESGEAAAMRERHAQYFLALAETAKSELRGPEAVAWLDRIDHQHDNLREALGWAREVNDLETGLRLSGVLCWFWWRRGYLGEGRRWVEGFISEDPNVGQPTFGLARAGALYGAGALAFGQGDLVRATELFEEGLTLYRELGDEVGVANVLVELGQVARAQGDYDRAATLSEESLALGRKLGERTVTAIALNTLGRVERVRGYAEGAIARYEEGLALFREGGDKWGAAYALANLGVAALQRGELERALALIEESFSLYKELGDNAGVALALINLGDVASERGDEERATALYNAAYTLHRELGNKRGITRALERLSPKR